MATAGTFILSANKGRSDAILTAFDYSQNFLNTEINSYMQKQTDGKLTENDQQILPVMLELSESHVVHFYRMFKPFLQLSYEYQKISPQNSQFGSIATYDISTFGDFISDICVQVQVSAVRCTQTPLPALPLTRVNTTWRQLISDSSDQSMDTVEFANQMKLTCTFNGKVHPVYETNVLREFSYKYVDSLTGQQRQAGELVQNLVKYCEYPGEKLIQNALWKVNSIQLDEFNKYSYVFRRNLMVSNDKMRSYNACMGQENPVEGVTGNLPNQELSQGTSTMFNYRQKTQVYNGYQTPQLQQPSLNLFIPMLFWFNTDHGQAFPGVSAPQNRQIQLQFENYSSIVYKESPVKIQQVMKQYQIQSYDVNTVPAKQEGWMQQASLKNYAAWLIQQSQQANQQYKLFQNQKFYVLSMAKLAQTVQLYALLDPTVQSDLLQKQQYDSLTNIVNVSNQLATSLTALNTYVTTSTAIDRTRLQQGQILAGFRYVSNQQQYSIFLIDDIQNLQSANVQNIVQDDQNQTDFVYSTYIQPPTDLLFSTVFVQQAYEQLAPLVGSQFQNVPQIQKNLMFVNNIFTLSEVHQLYQKKLGFNLVRVRKFHNESISNSTQSLQLYNMKYPTEYILCGVIPSANTQQNNLVQYLDHSCTDWDKFNYRVHKQLVGTLYKEGQNPHYSHNDHLNVTEEVQVVDDMVVETHGIQLYANMQNGFHTQYIPYAYKNFKSKQDSGIFVINFSLNPGEYQPSGYFNISRTRDFLVTMVSSNINQSVVSDSNGNSYDVGINGGTFVAESSSINFLLTSEGHAILRYST